MSPVLSYSPTVTGFVIMSSSNSNSDDEEHENDAIEITGGVDFGDSTEDSLKVRLSHGVGDGGEHRRQRLGCSGNFRQGRHHHDTSSQSEEDSDGDTRTRPRVAMEVEGAGIHNRDTDNNGGTDSDDIRVEETMEVELLEGGKGLGDSLDHRRSVEDGVGDDEDNDLRREENESNSEEDDEDEQVEDSVIETGDDDVLNFPQRKLKEPSPVWKCAVKFKEAGLAGVKCTICKKIFRMKDGNTTTILRHLVTQHKNDSEVKEMEKIFKEKKEKAKLKKIEVDKKEKAKVQNQPKIFNLFTRKRGIIDPIKEKKLDDALVKMTIMMNHPFADVEQHYFRQVLHIAEPNYICPSRRKHTKHFDRVAEKVKEDLKKEIINDVSGHRTIAITSDHGKSGDRFHTKKNAVTVARTDDNFVIKKDIVKMIECEKPQTGLEIKIEVKDAIVERAGYQEDWRVLWVTDGEAKQLNATNPALHHHVDMKIIYRGKCVDHTIELVTEESLKETPVIKTSVEKVRRFVTFLKDSTPAKVAFHKLMEAAGIEPLSMIVGTDNRWFFKYSEVRRALELKDTVDSFFDCYEEIATISRIENDDWNNLLVYENSLRLVVEASKHLEGELYPTASSVIPFLDTIFDDLKKLSRDLKTVEGRKFVNNLLQNFKSNRRFPDGYKSTAPYNILTLLDPRHADLYFNEDQSKLAFNELWIADIYNEIRMELEDDSQSQTDPLSQSQSESTNSEPQDSFSKRRAQLLARKKVNNPPQAASSRGLKGRLKEELERYLKFRGSLNLKENPMDWWRIQQQNFPLLAMFWKANSSFPATSTSAERAFSMDGMILEPKRQNLLPDRTGDMIVCRDYWMSRVSTQSFKLCSSCPKPPNSNASYVISCSKHNNASKGFSFITYVII